MIIKGVKGKEEVGKKEMDGEVKEALFHCILRHRFDPSCDDKDVLFLFRLMTLL